VRFRGHWLYLYLLLEFQSRVDPYMAVRLLTYLGLLYQDLIKQGALTAEGRLPPVLPVVLYNGRPRWRAATEVLDLIAPAPGRLRDYAPRLRYLLLDEGAVDEAAPWALRNLVAALFRLEKSADPAALQQALSTPPSRRGCVRRAAPRSSAGRSEFSRRASSRRSSRKRAAWTMVDAWKPQSYCRCQQGLTKE
jgi:hypothetical protein